MYGFIYVIWNKTTDKYYVGQTKHCFLSRLYGHIRIANKGGGYLFHEAIRNCGLENFFLVEVRSFPLEELDSQEAYFIRDYQAQAPQGYNILAWGQIHNGPGYWTGRKRYPETVAKVAAVLSEKYRGEGNPFYGRRHSGATRAQSSQRVREWWQNLSQEQRNSLSYKYSEAQRGRIVSPETRQKLSKAHKGKIISADTRRKIAQAKTGHKQSTVTIEKRRMKLKGGTHTAVSVANMTAAQRKRVPEESKQKTLRILEMLKHGHSARHIAETVGCTQGYIYSVRDGRRGRAATGDVPEKPIGEPTGAKRNSTEAKERKEQIIRLCEEGLSGAEIARRTGCSRTYVCKIKKDLIKDR